MTVRCLIVDDNDGFLQATQAALNSRGIDVVGVASTSAAQAVPWPAAHPDPAWNHLELGMDVVGGG